MSKLFRASIALLLTVTALMSAGCTGRSTPTPTVTVTATPDPGPGDEDPPVDGEWEDIPPGWDTTIDDSEGEVLLESILGGMAAYQRINESEQRYELVVALPDESEEQWGKNLPSKETVSLLLGPGETLEWAYAGPSHGTVFGVWNESDPEFFEIRWWSSWDEDDEPQVIWTPREGGMGDGREAAFDGTTLVFTTSTEDQHCLTSMWFGLETPPDEAIENVVCSETKLWWPRYSTDRTLSYLKGDSTSDCSQLFRLVRGAKKPEEVDLPGCVGRAQASATTAVWSELPTVDENRAVYWGDVPLRAMRPNGTIDDLGRGEAGSERVCGTGAIWKTAGASETQFPEVRQWTPDGETQTLYAVGLSPTAEEPTDPKYLLYGLDCYEDRVSFGRGDEWSADIRDVYLYSPALKSVGD